MLPASVSTLISVLTSAPPASVSTARAVLSAPNKANTSTVSKVTDIVSVVPSPTWNVFVASAVGKSATPLKVAELAILLMSVDSAFICFAMYVRSVELSVSLDA